MVFMNYINRHLPAVRIVFAIVLLVVSAQYAAAQNVKGYVLDKNGDGIPDPDPDDDGNPKPINGLATATYGMPSLEIPHPTVGLSVDLSWGEGLWFDEVEL